MAVKFYGVLSDTSEFSGLDASGIDAETRIDTLGYGGPGDNGGGQYRILDTSDTPDNFLIFDTATTGKQAHLIVDSLILNAAVAGVVSGNSTDQSAALQKLIHYLEPINGTLLIEGMVYITGQIDIGDNESGDTTAIIGIGRDSGFTGDLASGGRNIRIHRSGCDLQNLVFETLREPIGVRAYDSSIDQSSFITEDIKIHKCRFKNCETKENNRGTIGLSGGSGSQRVGEINRLSIADCEFTDCKGHQIRFRSENIKDVTIKGNLFKDIERPETWDHDGLILVGFSEVEAVARDKVRFNISNNTFVNCVDFGTGGNSAPIQIRANQAVIENNIIANFKKEAAGATDMYAILARSSEVRISGNFIFDCVGPSDDGLLDVKGGGAAGQNIISDNIILDCHGPDIMQLGNQEFLITGNIIKNTTGSTHTIRLRGSGGTQVIDNLFDNCAKITFDENTRSASFIGNRVVSTELVITDPHGGTAGDDIEDATIIRDNFFKDFDTGGQSWINIVSTTTRPRVVIEHNSFYRNGGSGSSRFIQGMPSEYMSVKHNTFVAGPTSNTRWVKCSGGKIVEFEHNYIENNGASSSMRGEFTAPKYFEFRHNTIVWKAGTDSVNTGIVELAPGSTTQDAWLNDNWLYNETDDNVRNLLQVNGGSLPLLSWSRNKYRQPGGGEMRLFRVDDCTVMKLIAEDNDPGTSFSWFGLVSGTTTYSESLFARNGGTTTEKRGTAIISNGSTSVQVAHGLNYRGLRDISRNDFRITYLDDLGSASYIRVSAVDNTNVTFAVDVDPGQDVEFAWEASHNIL